MNRIAVLVAVLACSALLPAAAYAQASIAGQVKDASGAVLPGVTVEAASPALIEKVRTVVTDGTGQYRVEVLPPGTYSLSFTLPGFNTVRRDGLILAGTFTAAVDAEMRVGAIEETITVTGETPLVDVQSQTRQRVMDRELIDTLPTGRTPFAMTALIPGVSVSAANQDVGGATLLSGAVQMQVHGSTGNSTMIMENGLSTAALVGAWGSQLAFNMAASQEVAVDYAGAGADTNAAGVKMNVIPREGGNTFNGTLFMNGTAARCRATISRSATRTRVCAHPTRSDDCSTSIPDLGGRSSGTGCGSISPPGTPSPRNTRRTSSTTRISTIQTCGCTSRT